MDIKTLKENIESKLSDIRFIFVNSEDSFLSNQYINAIAQKNELKVITVEEIKSLIPNDNDIFGIGDVIDETCLYVYKVDKFEEKDPDIMKIKHLIIVCDKIDSESKEIFKELVIEMPKLEPWQIKDYAYSIADGVNTKKLDWLLTVSNNNIHRVHNELSKLAPFIPKERDYVFDMMVEDDAFVDLSNFVIFDLSNAIIKKDIKTIAKILEDIKKIDVEPLGLQVILTNQFRNIISVQMSPNASAEKLGMNPKQFYAISKYSCGYYTREQLVEIFDVVSKCDYLLKNSDVPNDKLVDYMILHILSA